MKSIIIEDEKPSARRLKRMLEKQGVEVLHMLHSVKESVEWFRENPHPDLIFLDIQLGDGLSFEIFEWVEVKSAIVFTTAYDEYALKAFKLNSVDYLLKPIDEEELAAAIEKFKSKNLSTSIDLNGLQELFGEKKTEYKSRFSIKVGQHLKFFSIDEIAFFYSENKGTYLHTDSGRDYLMDVTLENLEKELSPEKFFRINRRFIINLNSIQDIVHYSNSRLKIKLKDFADENIIVSRERVKAFKEWLG
jgi:DNA-binding LytR/AlgR family response regulator